MGQNMRKIHNFFVGKNKSTEINVYITFGPYVLPLAEVDVAVLPPSGLPAVPKRDIEAEKMRR